MRVATLGVVLLALCSACGSSTTTPTPTSLSGTYVATTMLITPNGGSQQNALTQGGAINLVLTADASGTSGTTTGTISVPASLNGGTALTNASLAGTAVINGSSIKFNSGTNTFLKDLTFTVSGTTLTASAQTSGSGANAIVYTVTLTRQ